MAVDQHPDPGEELLPAVGRSRWWPAFAAFVVVAAAVQLVRHDRVQTLPVVVLTEQRLGHGSDRPPPELTTSPNGSTVTVRRVRAGWLVIADLLGDGRSAPPVDAARRWVGAAPLPR